MKYTAANHYATTAKYLKTYLELDQLNELNNIKRELLQVNLSDIEKCLTTAKQIRGLGIAGASGLLSLMYPQFFANVDKFVVEALRLINDLPDKELVQKINSESISFNNEVILIDIMRRKARKLNEIFHINFWTPRKIDMVL